MRSSASHTCRPIMYLTEQQRTDAIKACDGIEAALAKQQIALENIVRIFENMANGRPASDGLKSFDGERQ